MKAEGKNMHKYTFAAKFLNKLSSITCRNLGKQCFRVTEVGLWWLLDGPEGLGKCLVNKSGKERLKVFVIWNDRFWRDCHNVKILSEGQLKYA